MYRKKLVAIIVVSAFLFTAFGAYAASTITKITAQKDSAIKVKLNGNQIRLKGSDGKLTSVISYNGKNYMAADLIAEQVGLAYEFDSKTKTVYLGKKAGKGLVFNKIQWKYDGHGNNKRSGVTVDKDLLSIGEETLTIGMYAVNPEGVNVGSIRYCPQLTLNTDKKYQKLILKAGSEKSNNQAKVIVKDDNSGIVIKEIPLTDDQFNEAEIDIGSYSTVSIYAVGARINDYEKIVVGDIYLK